MQTLLDFDPRPLSYKDNWDDVPTGSEFYTDLLLKINELPPRGVYSQSNVTWEGSHRCVFTPEKVSVGNQTDPVIKRITYQVGSGDYTRPYSIACRWLIKH